MMVHRGIRVLLLAGLLAAGTAAHVARAVEPGEVLSDPALEERARALSSELRCMVCQNESIDNSNAELAHDLRVLVRERLKAGDSDEEVLDFVVARYGEFVLLKPRFSARNAFLWATPFIVLVGGAAIAWGTFGRRRRQTAALSPEEEARLRGLLGDSE